MQSPRARFLKRMVDLPPDVLLEKHFGIVNTNPNRQFLIHIQLLQPNELKINITYEKIYPFMDFGKLPPELSSLIHSYRKDRISIMINILYTAEYPFKPPIWSLLDVKHNIKSPIDLSEYYSYLIGNHNEQYGIDWSPAINYDIDILNFIQKINHFEYIV